MADRQLTWRDRNRTLLARQLLLERADLTVPKAVERIGGVQSQYAPSTYVGLWTRLRGFALDDLTSALDRRTVVQGTLMRGTIHVVSRRDYPAMAAGVRAARRTWWRRAARDGADDREMRATARRLRGILADGPLPRRELTRRPGVDSTTWNGLAYWIDLVRVPPSGTWERRSADLYGLADAWIDVADVDADDGIELLVRRYLTGFGPSTTKEIAGWSGVPKPGLDPVLTRMRLRRFAGEDGETLLDVPRGPIADGDAPAPVRFLPTWDATLLINERATRILPEELRPRVFNTRTPHSVPTFLVDGQVAGTWRFADGRIRVEPFGRLSAAVRREVDDEAERLGDLHREGC
jgi:Winged helix DNA-binding domain